MRVLLSGVVPGEGRYSMIRTARTLFDALRTVMPAGHTVSLHAGEEALASPARAPRWQVKLQKRLLLPLSLRFSAFDVLHIVDSDYAAAIPSSRLRQSVVTCHDLMPFLMAPRLSDIFSPMGVRMFRRSLARMEQAARVVCDSEFTRATVLEKTACRPERVSVVPLGVEPVFRPVNAAEVAAFRRKHGLADAPLVLHVGSTEGYKNIETVIRVVGRLRKEGNGDTRLLKVGGRFSTAQLDLMEAEGLADAVVHLTGLPEEDLVTAYNAASVLLWPSHFEGFGWPVLEAMACGLPVVCSNGGSLREVAGEAAAVCDPLDADGLTGACARVLSDADHAAAMRTRGLEWAATYSWERTARAYLGVYQEIAREAGQ